MTTAYVVNLESLDAIKATYRWANTPNGMTDFVLLTLPRHRFDQLGRPGQIKVTVDPQ